MTTEAATVGAYQEETKNALGWFMQTLMPSLSLIVGVVAYEATAKPEDRQIAAFPFLLAIGLSGVYLALVAIALLVQPIINLAPMETLQMSNLWLAPL